MEGIVVANIPGQIIELGGQGLWKDWIEYYIILHGSHLVIPL